MPEINKMTEAMQSKKQSTSAQTASKSSGSAPSYPKNPSGSDGQFEHTAAGQCKRNKF